MQRLESNPEQVTRDTRVMFPSEANRRLPPKGDFERMAKRRFQDPKPVRRGAWWTLLVWQDTFVGGVTTRKRKRIKLALATMPEREVLKIAAEHPRPLN